jgi:outer membrane lipoprotein LolB
VTTASPSGGLRRAWTAFAAWLLVGCATAPPRDPDGIEGRLAVQVAAHGSEAARAFSAGFSLRGDDRRGSLELSSALSMIARADWREGEATLVTSNDTRRYASIDAMAQDLLGTAVPMAALMAWLRGMPWSGAPHRSLAASPHAFVQLGWEVDLSRRDEGQFVAVRPAPEPRVTLRARLDAPS